MQLHTPDSLMLEMPTIRDTRLHSSRQGTENGQQRDADTGVLPHHWRRRVKCLTSPAIFHQGGTRKRGHGGWYWRRGRGGPPESLSGQGGHQEGPQGRHQEEGPQGATRRRGWEGGHQEVGSRGSTRRGTAGGTPSH